MKNIAKFFNHSQKNSRILSNDCRKILQISRSFGKKIAKLVKQVRKLLTILNKWLQNKIVNFICWLKMSIRKLQILSNERGIKKWISWNDHRIKLWISLVGHGNNCEVCQVDLEKKKWIFLHNHGKISHISSQYCRNLVKQMQKLISNFICILQNKIKIFIKQAQ